MANRFLHDIVRGRRRGKRLGGFARDDRGNAALEFGLVAPLFFAVMLSIFEVSMIFGTSVLLESAANKAARAVRTGQIYLATYDTTTGCRIDTETGVCELDNEGEVACPNHQYCDQTTRFKNAMCDELILIDCDDLSYDVQVFNDFSVDFSVAWTPVYCNADGDLESNNLDIGLPTQVVVLTVVYPYDPIIPNPLIHAGRDWKSAAEGGCNGLSMQSIKVVRNEPFPLSN